MMLKQVRGHLQLNQQFESKVYRTFLYNVFLIPKFVCSNV